MHDLVIVGAGPAGLTAALYAGRYKLDTVVFEKLSPGGQIIISPSIENYPGFPAGIATHELIERFKKQVEDLGIGIRLAQVLDIAAIADKEMPEYEVKTSDGPCRARAIILAVGAQPKPLGLKREKDLIGKGVSYCGTCDGPLYKGKDIVVVGGGDRALEEAIFLAGYAKTVTLVHRRQQLRASGILQEKAQSNPKIKFILGTVVEELIGKERLQGVGIRDVKSTQARSIAAEGLFIFVGVRPNTEHLGRALETDEEGFILTDEKMQTHLEGVFACGDCRKKDLYQVITACAEGAQAAASVHRYLL